MIAGRRPGGPSFYGVAQSLRIEFSTAVQRPWRTMEQDCTPTAKVPMGDIKHEAGGDDEAPKSREPDPNRVNRLLDSEIETAERDRQAQGWNQWAILGALGSTVAFALGILEKTSVDQQHAIQLGLIIWIAVDGVVGPLLQSRSRMPERTPGIRFKEPEALATGSPAFLARLVLTAGALWALSHINISTWVWVTASVHFGVGFLALGLVGLSIALNLPVVSNGENLYVPTGLDRILRVAAWAARLAPIVLVFALWSNLRPSCVSLADLKLGLLGAVAAYLFGKLADRAVSRRYEIDSIVEVRRRFLSGDIDTTEALENWEMIVRGKKGGELVQSDINDLENTFLSVERGLKSLGERSRGRVEARSLNGVKSNLEQAERTLKHLAVRALVLQVFARDERRDLMVIVSRLNNRLQELKAEAVGVSRVVAKVLITTMKSDLRNMVSAQESYFADHSFYAASLGDFGFKLSDGVVLTSLTVMPGAWTAVVTHAKLPGYECAIAVNAKNPLVPRAGEGEPACR